MSKIAIDRAVVEQALEALNASMPHNNDMDGDWPSHIAARRALRAALEQPQIQSGGIPPNWNQEPVLPGGGLAKLYIPPQPQVEQEPVAWQSIEAMAVQRYKVVPAHDSMFYRHAVVAGDGTQQLYIGRETECENIARRFAGAFLDGAYEASLYTQPQNLSCKSNQARLATLWGYVKEQPPRQPLTDEKILSYGPGENDAVWSYEDQIYFARAIERAHGITGEQE